MKSLLKFVKEKGKGDERVNCLCYSPDGRELVVAIGEILVILDGSTGEEIKRLTKGHSDEIYCVDYCNDGKRFASGGADTKVILWGSKGNGIIQYPHNSSVQCLKWNPVTNQLLSCSNIDFGLYESGEKDVKKNKIKSKPTCCDWSCDGQYFAIGTVTGLIFVFNRLGEAVSKIDRNRAQQDDSVQSFSGGLSSNIGCLAFNPQLSDYDIITVGDWANQSLSFYHISGKQAGKDIPLHFDPCSVCYFENGEYFLIGGSNENVYLYKNTGIFLKKIFNAKKFKESQNKSVMNMKKGTIGAVEISKGSNFWIWCIRQKNNYFSFGTEEGYILSFSLCFYLSHSTYRFNYVYRENLINLKYKNLLTSSNTSASQLFSKKKRSKSSNALEPVGDEEILLRLNEGLIKKCSIFKHLVGIQYSKKIVIFNVQTKRRIKEIDLTQDTSKFLSRIRGSNDASGLPSQHQQVKKKKFILFMLCSLRNYCLVFHNYIEFYSMNVGSGTKKGSMKKSKSKGESRLIKKFYFSSYLNFIKCFEKNKLIIGLKNGEIYFLNLSNSSSEQQQQQDSTTNFPVLLYNHFFGIKIVDISLNLNLIGFIDERLNFYLIHRFGGGLKRRRSAAEDSPGLTVSSNNDGDERVIFKVEKRNINSFCFNRWYNCCLSYSTLDNQVHVVLLNKHVQYKIGNTVKRTSSSSTSDIPSYEVRKIMVLNDSGPIEAIETEGEGGSGGEGGGKGAGIMSGLKKNNMLLISFFGNTIYYLSSDFSLSHLKFLNKNLLWTMNAPPVPKSSSSSASSRRKKELIYKQQHDAFVQRLMRKNIRILSFLRNKKMYKNYATYCLLNLNFQVSLNLFQKIFKIKFVFFLNFLMKQDSCLTSPSFGHHNITSEERDLMKFRNDVAFRKNYFLGYIFSFLKNYELSKNYFLFYEKYSQHPLPKNEKDDGVDPQEVKKILEKKNQLLKKLYIQICYYLENFKELKDLKELKKTNLIAYYEKKKKYRKIFQLLVSGQLDDGGDNVRREEEEEVEGEGEGEEGRRKSVRDLVARKGFGKFNENRVFQFLVENKFNGWENELKLFLLKIIPEKFSTNPKPQSRESTSTGISSQPSSGRTAGLAVDYTLEEEIEMEKSVLPQKLLNLLTEEDRIEIYEKKKYYYSLIEECIRKKQFDKILGIINSTSLGSVQSKNLVTLIADPYIEYLINENPADGGGVSSPSSSSSSGVSPSISSPSIIHHATDVDEKEDGESMMMMMEVETRIIRFLQKYEMKTKLKQILKTLILNSVELKLFKKVSGYYFELFLILNEKHGQIGKQYQHVVSAFRSAKNNYSKKKNQQQQQDNRSVSNARKMVMKAKKKWNVHNRTKKNIKKNFYFYYCYIEIYNFINSPFINIPPKYLFNRCLFLLNYFLNSFFATVDHHRKKKKNQQEQEQEQLLKMSRKVPKGVLMNDVFLCLFKIAIQLGLSRSFLVLFLNHYDILDSFKFPPNVLQYVELEFLKRKSFSVKKVSSPKVGGDRIADDDDDDDDKEQQQKAPPICFNCSTRQNNFITLNERCFKCLKKFKRCFISFEILPLVKFHVLRSRPGTRIRMKNMLGGGMMKAPKKSNWEIKEDEISFNDGGQEEDRKSVKEEEEEEEEYDGYERDGSDKDLRKMLLMKYSSSNSDGRHSDEEGEVLTIRRFHFMKVKDKHIFYNESDVVFDDLSKKKKKEEEEEKFEKKVGYINIFPKEIKIKRCKNCHVFFKKENLIFYLLKERHRCPVCLKKWIE